MSAYTMFSDTTEFLQIFKGETEYTMKVYDQERQLYQDNDILIVEEKNTGRFFTGRLTRVQFFMYFDQTFQAHNYKKFLPRATSVEDAIQTCEKIPGYAEKAREHGLLVFRINKISNIAE
jgi:ASC-1-like (ASCH) protein